MGHPSIHYERCARIVTALESALVQLDAVTREAWLELPEDEPRRDVELAAAVERARAELLKQLADARVHRSRNLPLALQGY